MKTVKFFNSYLILLVAVILFQSCATVPVNLATVKEQLIKYHNSGEYDKALNGVIKDAEDEFNLLFDKQAVKSNDAVVFDIDETALSNYEFNKEIGFGYSKTLWDEWIDSAKAPAIQQVKNLYDYLLKNNVKIIFITGRKKHQYNSTYKNLKSVGYTSFDTLITRQPSEFGMTAIDYKSRVRVELAHSGYNIIGDVGDQWSDLRGPYHGIQVKIPNYQYIIN